MLPEMKELLLRWECRHTDKRYFHGKRNKREFSRFLMLNARIILPCSFKETDSQGCWKCNNGLRSSRDLEVKL